MAFLRVALCRCEMSAHIFSRAGTAVLLRGIGVCIAAHSQGLK